MRVSFISEEALTVKRDEVEVIGATSRIEFNGYYFKKLYLQMHHKALTPSRQPIFFPSA